MFFSLASLVLLIAIVCLSIASLVLYRRRLAPVLRDVLLATAIYAGCALAVGLWGGCGSTRATPADLRPWLARYPLMTRQEITGDSVCLTAEICDTTGRPLLTVVRQCWGLDSASPLRRMPIVSRQTVTGDSVCQVLAMLDPAGQEIPIVRRCWPVAIAGPDSAAGAAASSSR